jgi:hypothetical protein
MRTLAVVLTLGLIAGPAVAQAPDVGFFDMAAAIDAARAAAVVSVEAARQTAKRDAAARRAGPQMLTAAQLGLGIHHQRHAEMFGAQAPGYNIFVLRGVDAVQSHAPEGGGYFANPKVQKPAESPVGYALSLFGTQILYPTRATSFCSGASFAAFIEALNLIFADRSLGLPGEWALSPDRLEAMLMQEPDAPHSRRMDGVKFWGHWNGSGFGANDALVQYSHMGTAVSPDDARPGDFLTMDWKSGHGHSAVFLGWAVVGARRSMLVWSSQKSADGFGDYLIPWTRVEGVNVVRLTNPEALMTFSVDGSVSDRGLAMTGPHWPPLARSGRARR